jgi:WD40 repeat protein
MNKNRRIKTLLIGLLIWSAGALILWFALPYKPKAVLSAPEDLVIAAFSPNGKIVATKSKRTWQTLSGYEPNGPICLWDIDSGKQIALFQETGLLVRNVLFSNDGKTVVLVSSSVKGGDRKISIFDVQTGQVVDVIHQLPFPLMFFPLGTFPLNVVQARCIWEFSALRSFQNCILSPDGKLLFFDSPYWLEPCVVWDIPTRRFRQNLNQWPLALSPDGQYCLFHSGEIAPQTGMPIGIVLHEFSTGRDIAKMAWTIDWLTNRVQVSSDGKLVMSQIFNESAIGQKEVKVWDVERGKELATLDGVIWPTFSRDGTRLAGYFLGQQGPLAIKVWDTATWREMSELQNDKAHFRGSIASITAGPGDKDFRAVVFDSRNVARSTIRQWLDHLFGSTSTATGSSFTDLLIFDVVSQEAVFRLRLQESSWLRTQIGSSAILSPDGRTLAVEPGAKTSPTEPMTIELFNVPADRPIVAIVLWPLLASFVFVLIFRLAYRRKSKHIAETMTIGSHRPV